MNRQELDILEKAFECEVNGDLTGNTGIFQSKSKIAEKLCADGYLIKVARQAKGILPMIIRGYALTHAGRFTYCDSDRFSEENVNEPLQPRLHTSNKASSNTTYDTATHSHKSTARKDCASE